MSYILDALKKADAERERSPVPGLHAHDGGFGIADRRDGPPWRAIAIGTVAALVALLAWLWWGRAEPVAPDSGAMPAPTAAPVPLPLADGRAAAPAAPPALPTAPPGPAPGPAPTASPRALPGAAPPAATSPRATAAVRTAAPPTAPAVATATAPARPTAGDAMPARLPTRNDLPADLRAALPPVNVSGAVYAPQASGRLLFANGLVLREGDAIADGLTVERIGPASSVLVFRGQRFEQPH